ncbi:MAG: hypothetical protein KKE57_06090 [Proteobacteria bacterium]|nr:hypothetical protein [Pseudomonadota bacterium]
MSAPLTFRDSEHLCKQLKKCKNLLYRWFDGHHETIEDAVLGSVGGNTFRSFKHMPHKPSAVFREWAIRKFHKEKTIVSLLGISSQSEYDGWLHKLTQSLHNSWKRRMGSQNLIPYGPRKKLPNLLLKQMVIWEGIGKSQRKRLMRFLHVPLDRHTLVAIRNCIEGDHDRRVIGRIPRNPTMGFVKNEAVYQQIQNLIRAITKRAGVPHILLDFLAWDMAHSKK